MITRPNWRREVVATWLSLLALVLWEASRLDVPLSRLYGDASGFVWRDAWFTSRLLHQGGRWVAGVVLLVMAWDALRPIITGPTRRQRALWLGVTVFSLIAVPAFKQVSRTSCPWDLMEFGGAATYVPHWLPGRDGGPGHCFPSGHAVAAFAFFSLYFLWREHRPTLARICLAVTLALGALFAWAQLARGAHYLSHSLWSAWWCWAIAVACALAQLARDRRAALVRPATPQMTS